MSKYCLQYVHSDYCSRLHLRATLANCLRELQSKEDLAL